MNKQELIEKYFSNGLSSEEFEQLEQFLENDSQLRDEFYNELEIKRSIAEEKHRSLKSRFQQLDKKTKKKTTWLPYAAAIALLIGIGTFIYSLQPNYQNLYAENFEAYPNIIVPTVRGANTSENKTEKAFNYYDTKNYKEAIKAFEELYKKDNTGYANFYYAMSLMANNQVEKAIHALENPNWQIPEKFQAQTDWYLALGYLKLKNKEKATIHFEKVIQTNGAMSAEAKIILSEIK